MEYRRRVKQSLTTVPGMSPMSILDKEFEPASPVDANSLLSKRMLKVLTNPQVYIKHNRSGKKTCCSVYFSETLQKLSIDKPHSNYILTTDIIAADVRPNDFASEMPKTYFLRVLTKKKVYELSTENKIVRDEFVKSLNALIKLSKDYMSSMGLKKYCESLIHSQQTDESLRNLYKNRHQQCERHESQMQAKETLEKEIVRGLLNNLIGVIEVGRKREECAKLKAMVNAHAIERSKLSYSHENLRNLILLKDKEMQSLKHCIKKVENQIEHLKKPDTNLICNIFSIKIWSYIIEYLGSKDVVRLRTASRSFRNIANRALSMKSVWRKLCLSTLHPRKVMYRLYIHRFYYTAIRGNVFEVHNDITEEIHNDVWRGLNDSNKETEEVLMELCRYNHGLGYCQGMHFVAHFLYGILGTSGEVLRVMDSMLRPPFYLAELWKNGFSRLKLGLFQLEFLLKIRLPFMHKHLRDLDINLDMIVTPWFLTVFTYLHYQQELPKETVMEIWDFFLLQGWPALISVCLAIFDLTQELVLKTNLEQTLTILTSQIPCKDLSKRIPKYEVDPRLLDDLEGSFLCSNL